MPSISWCRRQKVELAGSRVATPTVFADAQGPSLRLAEAASKRSQVGLPAGPSANHRQQMKGQQRPERIGLDASSIFGHLLKVGHDGTDRFDRVARADGGLGLDHGQGRLEVFGLQAAARRVAEFPHEEPFRLVVSHIIIALVAATTISLSQLFPAVSGIDRATKLLRINKGFDHQDRVAIAHLPVRA